MRAIRRTSSRLPRAVSCASITPSREVSVDVAGDAAELQHDPGQRLPDAVVELLRDPQPLALLRGQRAAHAVAALGLEPLEHLVEGRGQLGRLGVAAADLEPVAGLERVDPARELRQLAQRGERVPQQQQVERQHQDEAAAEDRQLAQRDVLDARGEHERGDRARRGEHRGVADGESPEERRTARASEHRRSLAVGATRVRAQHADRFGFGRHRHANRSVLEGVWPRARRQ